MRNVTIDIWTERDRAAVVVTDEDKAKTLYELWDGDVSQLVDDGFINWVSHDQVERYLHSIGVLKFDDSIEYT